jgi:outer membrane receptor for ferric coprogen and ferric-rhodotorulic acid
VNGNIAGLPTVPNGSDLGWSRSTFFGMPDDRMKSEDTRTTLYLEQQFSERWAFKGNYTHSVSEFDAVYVPQWGVPDLTTGDGLMA